MVVLPNPPTIGGSLTPPPPWCDFGRPHGCKAGHNSCCVGPLVGFCSPMRAPRRLYAEDIRTACVLCHTRKVGMVPRAPVYRAIWGQQSGGTYGIQFLRPYLSSAPMLYPGRQRGRSQNTDGLQDPAVPPPSPHSAAGCSSQNGRTYIRSPSSSAILYPSTAGKQPVGDRRGLGGLWNACRRPA